MKNWEERFDKKFEGELWLGKYIDVDENGNQYVHRLELKDFIRRLLEEQAEPIWGSYGLMEAVGALISEIENEKTKSTLIPKLIEMIKEKYKALAPATDKLQIIK